MQACCWMQDSVAYGIYARLCWHKAFTLLCLLSTHRCMLKSFWVVWPSVVLPKVCSPLACFTTPYTTEAFFTRISSSCFSGEMVHHAIPHITYNTLSRRPSATGCLAILRAQENRLSKRKHLQNWS